MIVAVYVSHIAQERVPLPLLAREHPLRAWAAERTALPELVRTPAAAGTR